jgi:hypothetical protein
MAICMSSKWLFKPFAEIISCTLDHSLKMRFILEGVGVTMHSNVFQIPSWIK